MEKKLKLDITHHVPKPVISGVKIKIKKYIYW